jgi:hypothetical protein
MSVRLTRWAIGVGVGGFVVLLASPFVSRPASALSRADAMCRSHLFAAAGKLARNSIVQLRKCHAQRMAGRLPAATECNSSATTPNRTRLLRDEESLRNRVHERCTQPADVSPPAMLGFTSCPAPCEAISSITSYDDVAECLICRTRVETTRLVADAFGSPPTPAGVERRCQSRIGNATRTYLAAQLNLQRRCHLEQDLGRLGPGVACRTYDPRGKLVLAAQRLHRAIAVCGNDDLSRLNSCGGTVDDEQLCLQATADTAAAGMYATVFSVGTSTVDVATATGVRGQTVTIPVSLSGGAGITTLISVDIDYDPTQVKVAQLGSQADCIIDPAIGAGTAADKTLSAFVLPPAGTRERLRVSVFGLGLATGIPDGVLFRCNFAIQSSASTGAASLGGESHTFDNAGNPLPSLALGGEINVQPTGVPAIDISDAAGHPGETVAIAATLSNGDDRVASLSTEITYDPAEVRVSGGAIPNCTIDPAISSGSPADKMLDAEVSSSGGLETLLVTVSNPGNSELIPDGPLFTCDFDIAPGATTGTKLLSNQPAALNASGAAIVVDGRHGEIEVVLPLLAAGTAAGMAGETVSIPVSLTDGESEVVEAEIDITYDASQVRVGTSGADPDCTIAPALGAGTPAEKVLASSILSGPGGMETLRLELTSPTNSEPLPDGLLVTCNFAIDAAASPGGKTLAVAAVATDAAGAALTVISSDGLISVVSLPLPRIDVGHGSGDPGDLVAIPVSLSNCSAPISAVSTDVVYEYDATRVRVKRIGATPDCTINPAIGPGTVPGKMLLLAVSDRGGGIERLRVGVISFSNSQPIPDGLLFTCNFQIDAAAPAGVVVLHNNPSASTPLGDELLIYGTDGSVTVF